MNYITKILMGLVLFGEFSLSVKAMKLDTNPNIKVTYLHGDVPVRLVEFDLQDKLKSFCADGTVKLWNVDTGNWGDMLSCQGNWVTAAAVSPDGRFTASGHADGSFELFDVLTKNRVNNFWGHKDFVSALAFSPDGRFIVSGSWDKTVKLWDLVNKKCVGVFISKLGHNDRVNAVAFGPNGRIVASGSNDGTLILWNIYNKEFNYRFVHNDKSGSSVAVNSVAFNKNGTRIAVGLSDGRVAVYTDFFALVRILTLVHVQNSCLEIDLPAQSLNAYILQLIYENLHLKPWETVFCGF